VQCDRNNARLNETILAAITSNIAHVREPTQLLIDPATSEGRTSGLLVPSAVLCDRLHTIAQADVQRVIVKLTDPTMQKIDECLKAALGIP